MTAADDANYEFDVAVSFAGEDRDYVEEIVAPLKAANVRVFYDSDYMAETWGENLVEFFDDVYRKRSRFAMLFISRHYAEKMWPRTERRSALARAMEQRAAYVLPVRLDDSEVDGLLPTVGLIDARRHGVDGIVRAALKKIADSPAATAGEITRVPRTEAEQQLLLLEKPDGWEYLYFGSELLRRRDAIEHKYRDHEMRYGKGTGVAVQREDFRSFLDAATSEAGRLAASLDPMMDPQVQERAFGAPGEPGDADRIAHLADRWNSLYESFMDWAAGLRGTAVPMGCGEVVETLARFADQSIENYRSFVTRFVEQADALPQLIQSGEPINIEMTVVLDIPEEAVDAYDAAIQRLAERFDD